MSLCMLLTMEKGFNLIFKFSLVLLADGKLVFAEFHLAEIISPFTFPFQYKVYLRSRSVGSDPSPAIVAADGGNA